MKYANRIVLALVLSGALCGPAGAGIVESGELITSNNASSVADIVLAVARMRSGRLT